MQVIRVARSWRVIGAAIAAVMLSGCSNPFISNYKGERLPRLTTAHVAVAAPNDATLIGTSDFVTDVAPGNREAIAAARQVGADIVQWDRAFLRQDVTLLQDSLAGDGLAPEQDGELPVEQPGAWYRIHARFWRSNALGGSPAAAPDAPVESNEPS